MPSRLAALYINIFNIWNILACLADMTLRPITEISICNATLLTEMYRYELKSITLENLFRFLETHFYLKYYGARIFFSSKIINITETAG